MDPTDLTSYADAIKSIESSGGNYGLTGPATRNGDRAYGAYQVMGNNIPSWTQKHFGTALTPQQFLQNKEAQDAVFNGEFGSYVQKHGNPQDAASMWFTGRPLAQGGQASDGYITGNQYVDKFNKYLGGGQSPVAAINGAAGIQRPQGGPALAFSGDDEDGGAPTSAPVAGNPANGALFADSGEKETGPFGLPAMSDKTYSGLMGIASSLAGITSPNQAAGLRALAKDGIEQGKGQYQYMMGPNGQLVKINKDTGEVNFATLPGGGKGSFGIVMGKDAQGNPTPIGKINHSTGDYSPYGGQQGTAQAQEEQPTTMDDLRTLSPTRANSAQAVLDGAVALPKINTRSTPEQRQLRNDVLAIGATKGLDESKFTARSTAYKNLNNKSASQLGGQLTQLGHSGDIMAQLGEDGEALHNSGYRLANALPAAIGNNSPAYQEYAGKSAAFDQKADGLIGELSKLYNGSQGGGVTERAIMRQNTPRASDPPEIIAAKLQALRDLYESRMHEMKQQVGAPFGDDADSVLERYMPKSAQASLDRSAAAIGNLHSGNKSAAKAPAAKSAAPAIPSSWEDAQKAGWK